MDFDNEFNDLEDFDFEIDEGKSKNKTKSNKKSNEFDDFEFDEFDDTDSNLDSEDSFLNKDDEDYGFDFDEDYTYESEINYKSYESKVLRIFTKDIEKVTRGHRKDLYGDICLVEEYDEKNEILIIEKLGKMEKMRIEKKYIDKITGAKLTDEIKRVAKGYKDSDRAKVRAIRYILRNIEKEEMMLREIGQILHKIGYMAEETYEPKIDRDDRYGEFNTYGGLGGRGSYGSINSRFSGSSSTGWGDNYSTGFNSFNSSPGGFRDSYNNNMSGSFGGNSGGYMSPGSTNQGKGLFGGLFGKKDTTYNNSDYNSNYNFRNGYGNKSRERKSFDLKNSEGMGLFKKDIFGNEKAVYERTKSGKKKKKPTVMMNNGKTYYVKLLGGEMMVVYVKVDQVKDENKKIISEEKYYYSEYGLVEAREIVWFREKTNDERGTSEIKQGFQRVFSLEKQLVKLYDKLEERHKIVQTETQRMKQLKDYLHKVIIKSVRDGEILYQSRSKIEFGLRKGSDYNTILVKGIDMKIMSLISKRYRSHLKKFKYNKETNLLLIPVIRGVRYAECKELFDFLIDLYGNAEKRRVRTEMLEVLKKALL